MIPFHVLNLVLQRCCVFVCLQWVLPFWLTYMQTPSTVAFPSLWLLQFPVAELLSSVPSSSLIPVTPSCVVYKTQEMTNDDREVNALSCFGSCNVIWILLTIRTTSSAISITYSSRFNINVLETVVHQ